MSNLIKSGFIAFSQNDKLVIDANQSDIIRGIDSAIEERMLEKEKSDSAEEELAAAMIRDVGLDEEDDLLKMDTLDLGALPEESSEQIQKKADEILMEAKREAEEIVSKAHDETEKLRADAFEEAVALKEESQKEGYRAGYDEGMADVKSEFDAKIGELEQKEEEFERYMASREEELLKTTEQKMVELLCQMIPTVTGVAVENQKSVLFYMINAAMRDLENSRRFVIRVSSEDYEDLCGRKNEIYGALNPNIEIEVFEDSKLSALQCVIETDNGLVDVSLDVQLDNLKKALRLMVQE